MPKSMREELAVLIGLEVLTEGVFFDTHDLRKLPYNQARITKVLKALLNSRVLERVNSRKYLFSVEFLGVMKEEICRKAPRSGILQFPSTTIFDMCGVENWTEDELEQYVKGLRKHWVDLSGKQRAALKA
jgi:hypothetical protein